MGLVRLQDLMERGQAVGAFSVANLEMIQGAVLAAEEMRRPIILQIAEARLDTAPLAWIGPAMLAAARGATVEVGVHLDHGLTLDCIQLALDLGFGSVMIDGSHLPMAENIRLTQRVMDMARGVGAGVEAEIGSIGRTEAGKEAPALCANPEDCLVFVRETGVDALAVAIGNQHGVYAGMPQLRFDILEDLRGRLDLPLVLHGGTGISAGDFRRLIGLGMRKINIATAGFQACAWAAQGAKSGDLFDMSRRMTAAMSQMVRAHIQMFEEV